MVSFIRKLRPSRVTEGTQTVFTGQSTIWRRWGLVQGDAKLDFDPPTADEDVLDDQPQ